MKRLVSIIIMILISLLTVSCSITPMKTNTDSNAVETDSSNIKNDDKGTTSSKKTTTINALVPKGNSTLWYYNNMGAVKLPEGIELNLLSTTDKDALAIEPDKIITKLLAHSNEFDIYFIGSDQELAKSIVDKGYYVDLLQNDKLKAYFDKMYPQIKKWSMSGDKTFGFPTSLWPDTHMVMREEQLEKLGYSIDDLKTFDDVLKFNDDWRNSKYRSEIGKGVYASMNEVCPYIIKSYLLSHYDYEKMYEEVDTKEFRDLLKGVKELSKNTELGDWNTFRSEQNYLSALPVGIFNLYPIYLSQSDNGEMIPAPVPLVGSETPGKYSMPVSFYIINPYSKNIDAAMEVMVQIAEMSKHLGMRDLLYKDMESYQCDNKDCSYGSTLTRIYNDKKMFSYMGNFYDKYEMYFAFPGMEDILATCSEYMQDNIQLDEAIERIKQNISVVQRENAQ
jgi:uncharacterized protein YxeA